VDKPIIYIGLDVHKDTVAVAAAEGGKRGEVREYGKVANSTAAVTALAVKLARGGKALRFCYEAGPCGYGIQRELTAAGHDCVVVAPSLIPRKPGDRVKTDRRDAINLAKLHRAGELTAVWVPDQTHEAIRDLVRARQAAVRTLRQARQQLSGFLLRHGRHYHRPAWTLMHRRWLASLKFDQPVHYIVLEDCIAAVDAATARRDRLEAHIEATLPDCPSRPLSAPCKRSGAWRWCRRRHWWPNSATSPASPILASSWPISAWCRPSTPAAKRVARVALPKPATAPHGGC
jgi:transposase